VDVLRFMGRHATNVWLDRIAIEGLPDDSSTSVGFNVIQGVSYAGELPRSPTDYDYYFLSGTFTVRNSSFTTMGWCLELDGFLKDNLVTIGGSRSTGNVFKNAYAGIDTETAQNSSSEISYNSAEGILNSMDVEPYHFSWTPSKPSRYFIHDNQFTPTGLYADGIFIYDDPANHWIDAIVYNNTIEPQDTLYDGIGIYNTKGSAIWNNTITGSGADAIGLWGSTFSVATKNNVSDFTLDPTYGLAQIYLDPATSYDLVVCSNFTDTVLDQGTKNKVVGCTAGEAIAPTTSAARPTLPRRMPPLR